MPRFEKAIADARRHIPDCLAAGRVDLTTGVLLDVAAADGPSRDILSLVGAATSDLFNGPNVSTIEQRVRESRGVPEDGRHYFEEILVFSERLVHVFLRSKLSPEQAFVFVCPAHANVGLVLAKSRLAAAEIQAAHPPSGAYARPHVVRAKDETGT